MKTFSQSSVQREMIFGFIERQLHSRLTKLETLRDKNDEDVKSIREKVDILSQQLGVDDTFSSSSKELTLLDKIRAYCRDIREGNVPTEEISEQNYHDKIVVGKHSRKASRYESVKGYNSSQAANINVEINQEKSDTNLPSFDNLPSGTETRCTSAKSTRYLNPEKVLSGSGETKTKLANSNASEKNEASNTKNSSKKGVKARDNLTLTASASISRLNVRPTKSKEDAGQLIQEKAEDKLRISGKKSKVGNKEQAQTRNPTPIKSSLSRKVSVNIYHEETDDISESAVSDNGGFRPIRSQKTVQKPPEDTKPVKKSTKVSRKEDTTTKAERQSNSGRTKVKFKTTKEKKALSPTASSATTVSNENSKKNIVSRSKTPIKHMTLNDVTPVKPGEASGRRSATPNKLETNLTQSTPGRTTPVRKSVSPKPKIKTDNAAKQLESDEPLGENLRKSQRPKRKTKNPAESETPSFSEAKEMKFKSQNVNSESPAIPEKAAATNKTPNNAASRGRDPQLSLMQGEERWDKNLLSLDLKEMEQEDLLASLDHIEDKLHYKEFKEDFYAEEEKRRHKSIVEADPSQEIGSPERKVSKFANRKKNLELNIETIERDDVETWKKADKAWQQDGGENEESKRDEKGRNTSSSLRGEEENNGEDAKALTIEISKRIKEEVTEHDGHPFESDNSPIERKNEPFSYQEEEDVNGVNEPDDVNASDNQSQSDINTQPNAEDEKEEEANIQQEEEEDDVNHANDDNDEEDYDPNDVISPKDADEQVDEDNIELLEESAKESNFESAKKFWSEQESSQNAAIELRKKSILASQGIASQKEDRALQEEQVKEHSVPASGDSLSENKLQEDNGIKSNSDEIIVDTETATN